MLYFWHSVKLAPGLKSQLLFRASLRDLASSDWVAHSYVRTYAFSRFVQYTTIHTHNRVYSHENKLNTQRQSIPSPTLLLTSWQTSRSCFMAKNTLAQEKFSAKVFSSPISRYPLFSVPAERKDVRTAIQCPAAGEQHGDRQRPHMSGS